MKLVEVVDTIQVKEPIFSGLGNADTGKADRQGRF
jgi:hypothetical protein